MKERIARIKKYLKTHKKTIIVLAIIKLLIKLGIVGYLLLGATDCKAQSANTMIRSGNKLYSSQKYNNATEQYSKALQKEPKNSIAYFNQSDALYQLKEHETAVKQFTAITQSTVKPEVKSKAWHNLGNCYYRMEKYEESVKAYKECLKINPSDKDTKYNLLMAMAKLKQKGGGGQDQKKDEHEDKKNQQQKQDQQQNKSEPKEQQNKMSNEEAQRLLEALSNEENKVQQKLEKKKGEAQKVNGQKDW